MSLLPPEPKTPDEPVELEGTVERIVYESADTGFFVARLRQEGNADLVTFVGNVMAVSTGETIRIRGHWVNDKRWGRQVRADSYETLRPNSEEGIRKYLGSGLIQGIGKVYAERLVDAFGVDTLRIIDEHPERLTSVEGIGAKRASQIRVAWEKQRAVQSIMVFLQSHGIQTGQAVRIYKRYGDAAVTVLRDNPYRLASEITGIGFAGADKIAAELGVAKNSTKRLRAGLLYTLQQASLDGHLFLNRGQLVDEASELLAIDPGPLSSALDDAAAEGDLIVEDDAIFLPNLHAAERDCDHFLKRLLRVPPGDATFEAENALRWVEREQNIELSPEQREAVRIAAEKKVMVLTGGPGTGKTTLITSLVAIFEKKGLQLLLAAPTGRAAKRMEEATGREAKTIHRLLEFSPKLGGFTKDENDPLDADVVVIDEMSMVDALLMQSLLRAVPLHARLLLVGDIDQLPSVGPGNVLMDIIASGVVPKVHLETIFRQAAQSGIVTNAHLINQGQPLAFNDTDCFFIERKEPQDVLDTVHELVAQRIPEKFGFDPATEIQVLAPMHKGLTGVANLNLTLQEALNPHGQPVSGRSIRLGDKVIQTRNNYELDTFNGDVGVVTVIAPEVEELHVQFQDRIVLYPFDELDDLSLAYAITIHKSQGSEYPVVIIPLVMQHYPMLQRNILYTALTRAKSLAIIVGHPKALARAVHNTEVTRRNTSLVARLKNDETL